MFPRGLIRSEIRRCSANCFAHAGKKYVVVVLTVLLMQEIIKEEEIIILASGTKIN